MSESSIDKGGELPCDNRGPGSVLGGFTFIGPPFELARIWMGHQGFGCTIVLAEKAESPYCVNDQTCKSRNIFHAAPAENQAGGDSDCTLPGAAPSNPAPIAAEWIHRSSGRDAAGDEN